MEGFLTQVGLVAGIVLPFFNIPLILRIIKRKSSDDISLTWASGVWVCILLMAPTAFRSVDLTYRTFSIINFILFSGVMAITLKYRIFKK